MVIYPERIKKICLVCGKTIYNQPNREKTGRGNYCSKKCYYLSKKGKHQTKETIEKRIASRKKSIIKNPNVKKICEYCKKNFIVNFNDGDRKYCSPECYFLSKKGKVSHRKGIAISDDKKYWTSAKQNLLMENWSLLSKQKLLNLFPSKSWGALLNEMNQIRVKRKLNIPKRPKSDISINAWNYKEEISEQYNRGVSAVELAKKFNADRDLILNLLRKNNIKIRINSEAQTIHQNKPEVRKKNSEQSRKRLENPEELKRLIEVGKKSRKPYIYTEKEEMVYSKGEQEIANFLHKHNIGYEINKPLKLGNKIIVPDFFIPKSKTYIEYWGFQGAFDYDIRMKEKQEAYKKYNISVIEITYSDFRSKKIPEKLSLIFNKRNI